MTCVKQKGCWYFWKKHIHNFDVVVENEMLKGSHHTSFLVTVVKCGQP